MKELCSYKLKENLFHPDPPIKPYLLLNIQVGRGKAEKYQLSRISVFIITCNSVYKYKRKRITRDL